MKLLNVSCRVQYAERPILLVALATEYLEDVDSIK